MWQGQSARRPVFPPLSLRVLSEGLEGLDAESHANTLERTLMPLYEHVFLARQDASPQQVEELTTQMTGIVEQAGGKVTKTENWGVRSLTYRMNKNRKAHFVLLNIDAPSAVIAEIERQERISEDVIRYLSVRVEEHEEGPSAMMRKADRDRERDDRGGGGFRDGGFRGDREGGGFRGGDREGGGFRGGDRDGGGFRGDRGPRRPREDTETPAEE
jgi:small subunit ribosomal protein S6